MRSKKRLEGKVSEILETIVHEYINGEINGEELVSIYRSLYDEISDSDIILLGIILALIKDTMELRRIEKGLL